MFDFLQEFYNKWLIKRRGAYTRAALIWEQRLFQLWVKHWGEYGEN